MNPQLFSRGLWMPLVAVIALVFNAGWRAVDSDDVPTAKLASAEVAMAGNEGCPYPPQTPAATATDTLPSQPSQPRPYRGATKPAVFIEVVVPVTDAEQQLINI